MQLIELKQIPNQTFTIMLNGVDYKITVRTIQDLTFISVWANGDLLFYNQICPPNAFVNPYDYISKNGKLYFGCITSDYPNYKQFGITQNLYFLTPEEVSAL